MQKYSKNRLIIGKEINYLPEAVSTNSLAAEWLKEGRLQEGAVVCCDYQSGGRGQAGNAWESEKGKNLTFSIVLPSKLVQAQEQFYLNMAVCLGLYDFLTLFFEGVTIKWPNDLYIHHKKIAGVLIENSLQGSFIKSSIAGIGLNVNQEEFPKCLRNPTSMQLEKPGHYPLELMLEQLLDKLDARFLHLQNGRRDELYRQFNQKLYRLNKPYIFEVKGELLEGTIRGVSRHGLLQVEINEEIQVFQFKEIRYLYELWN